MAKASRRCGNYRLRATRTRQTCVASVRTRLDSSCGTHGAVSWVETRPENQCGPSVKVDCTQDLLR